MASFAEPAPETPHSAGGPAIVILSAAAILLVIACLAWLIWAADRGFDIADDAYYFATAADVYSYRFSLTEFGQLWHPVYLLVGGHVGLFRLAGAALLLSCASVFACCLIGPRDRLQIGTLPYLALFAALTGSVFWFYGNWFPTPNYNTINLASLLLFFAGLLAAGDECCSRGRLAFWLPSVLAGVGLCGMALVKPPSAVLAALAGLAWLVVARPPRAVARLAVAAAVAAAAFLVVILVIDGSLADFVSRKQFSMEALALRDRGYDLGSLVAAAVSPFAPGRIWKVFDALSFGLILSALAAGWVFFTLSAVRARGRLLAGAACAAVFCILVARWRAGDLAAGAVVPAYHVWHFAGLLVAGCLLLAVCRSLPPRQIMLATLLMAAPVIYAFGTVDTLVLALSAAGIFWIAGGIFVAKALPAAPRQTVLVALGFFSAASMLAVLVGMGFSPWRGAASLWAQHNRLALGSDHVRVDDATSRYLQEFQQVAAANGFPPGGALMDLSGFGPGVGLAMGAKAVGSPWLSPRGQGAMAFNRYILRSAGDLRQAWIITRGAGDGSAEAGLLQSLGLNFPDGYERLVSRSRPDMGWDHVLWKPRPNP